MRHGDDAREDALEPGLKRFRTSTSPNMPSEPRSPGATDVPTPAGTRSWKAVVLVALVPLVLFAFYALWFHPSDLYVTMLNDQVGYITTARWLAETCELRSHLVVPAFLEVENWRLYMPGHYVTLALSYLAFGEGVWTWRLPNVLALVVSTALVFVLGRRLHGSTAGFAAVALFLVFPRTIADAYTAMSEPTFTAVSLAMACLLVSLPERLRLRALPLLLVLPFLFRETGALLILPFLGLALHRPLERRQLRAAAFAVAVSIVLLGLLYAWQTGTGKQAPPLSWIATGRVNYGDALLEQSQAAITPAELARGILVNFQTNLKLIWHRQRHSFFELTEPASMLGITLLALVAFVAAARGRRQRLFALGTGLMFVATLGFVLLLHKGLKHVTLRHLAFTLPFLALTAGAVLDAGARQLHARLPALATKPHGLLLVPLLLPLAFLLHVGLVLRAKETVREDARPYTAQIEAFLHDDERLLVSQPSYGLDYTLRHPPVRWSFLPTNDATLRLLAERYDIGTLILDRAELNTTLTQDTLRDLGFVKIGELRDRTFVFRDRAGATRYKKALAGE